MVRFDAGDVEEVDPNTLRYAELDYPELQDVVWVHPSPEKALEGDPYLHQRSRHRPRKTASAGTSLSPSVTVDSDQMHTDSLKDSENRWGIDISRPWLPPGFPGEALLSRRRH